MMPGIDGFETCRRLGAQPTTADAPVLFMTALNETADKVRAFAAGGVDYITKPIEQDEALARVRTHLALRRLRRELADELEQKKQFMRIASHDLRNPVCLILMAVELARRSAGDQKAVSEHLGSIGESVAQIRRIIDTFLGIRVPLGGCADAGVVDLGLLGTAVARQHEPAAEAKRIALHTEESDAVLVARGDTALTYQALANLVSNALKFTPAGGRVNIRPRIVADAVRVEVTDSGPGVPAKERDQLFTIGAQLTPRPTHGEETHGHGLSIVKQLVEAQAGRVGAEFPKEGGSVFWFELPAAERG
jgi:signal transduction histidine kinase